MGGLVLNRRGVGPWRSVLLDLRDGFGRWKTRLGRVEWLKRHIFPDGPNRTGFGKKSRFADFQTMEIASGFVNSNSSSADFGLFNRETSQPSSCLRKRTFALKNPTRRRSAQLLQQWQNFLRPMGLGSPPHQSSLRSFRLLRRGPSGSEQRQ